MKDFRKKKSRILSLFVLISLNSYFHLEIMEKWKCVIDKLCAINLNYLLMKQSILIQQASLSDIEAVVRKVLDDILDDLKLQKSEDSIRLLTRTEAAKMLRISLPTLADWTRQGMIPAQRIGRRVLYAISDIENTLEGKKGGRKNG